MQFCSICLIALLLSSCSGNYYVADVGQIGQPPSVKMRKHVVARGDTLYSISWRYGMDFRKVAKANNISSPYTIYPGQVIILGRPKTVVNNEEYLDDEFVATGEGGAQVFAAESSPDESVSEVAIVAEPETLPSVTGPVDDEENPLAGMTSPAVAPPPAEVIEETPTAWPQASVNQGDALRWRWPATGSVIGRFSSTGKAVNKGIDISGREGEPVHAAAGGSIVYAGEGLYGYGKLIIIKHDDTYLSAYGHNKNVLVKEGDVVASGDRIAEIGSTGTDSTKLHFEIRKDGKPVDPLLHLPSR